MRGKTTAEYGMTEIAMAGCGTKILQRLTDGMGNSSKINGGVRVDACMQP